VSWSPEFDDPIVPPNGRKLVTLKDAGAYIAKLPKAEHDAPEWQTAMEVLILTAEHGQPGADPMMARIAMMRALNKDKPKAAPKPRRKQARAYRLVQ
jgi:hypothetical protein